MFLLLEKINFSKSKWAGLCLLLSIFGGINLQTSPQAFAQNYENQNFSLPSGGPYWNYLGEENENQWSQRIYEAAVEPEETIYSVDLKFKLPPGPLEEEAIFRITKEAGLERDPLYNPFHWSFKGRTIKLGRHKDPVCAKLPNEIRSLLSYCQYKYFMSVEFRVQ